MVITAAIRPPGLRVRHLAKLPYTWFSMQAIPWPGISGIMPSDDLLLYFHQHLCVREHWRMNGTHYEKTVNAWLLNMEARKSQVLPILARAYGPQQVRKWWVRWRAFFLACAELWGYGHGQEWLVSHFLFEKSHIG
jgi:cyclopropane-fatty-acyl-phospholipid synthase